MIISAGFDSAEGDPLGDPGVTQDGKKTILFRLCIYDKKAPDFS